jgi:hypothetical protein
VGADEKRTAAGAKLFEEREGYMKVLNAALKSGTTWKLIKPASTPGEAPVVGDGAECSQVQKYRIENIARALVFYYKGIAQVLFETGWWKPDVDGKSVMLSKMPAACKITGRNRKDDSPLPPPDRVGSIVLASRADFAAEMSELQKVCHNGQFYANILVPHQTNHVEPDPHSEFNNGCQIKSLSSGRSCSRAHLKDEPEVPSRARWPWHRVLLGWREDVLPPQ